MFLTGEDGEDQRLRAARLAAQSAAAAFSDEMDQIEQTMKRQTVCEIKIVLLKAHCALFSLGGAFCFVSAVFHMVIMGSRDEGCLPVRLMPTFQKRAEQQLVKFLLISLLAFRFAGFDLVFVL